MQNEDLTMSVTIGTIVFDDCKIGIKNCTMDSMDYTLSVTTDTMAYNKETTSFEKCAIDMMKYTMRFEKRILPKIEEKDKVIYYDRNKLQPMGSVKCSLKTTAAK
jgi:hypothetical protein